MSIKLAIVGPAVLVLIMGGCVLQRKAEGPIEETPKPQGEFPLSLPLKFKPKPFRDLRQHTFTQVGEDADASISPDGKLLAFSSSRHSGEPDVYIKPVDGRMVSRKTFDQSAEIQPTFSPDGQFIAFASNLNGNWDIFVIRTDEETTRRQVTTEESEDLHPSWSPDGKKLVYCSYSYVQGGWELWIADLESGAMTNLGYGGLFPQWSPRGDMIVFQRARARDEQWFDVWTVHPDGSNLTQVVGSGKWGAINPAWSSDGKRIYFATVPPENQGEGGGLGRGRDIWAFDLASGAHIQITADLSPDWGPACSADGRIYFCSERNGFINIWSLVSSM